MRPGLTHDHTEHGCGPNHSRSRGQKCTTDHNAEIARALLRIYDESRARPTLQLALVEQPQPRYGVAEHSSRVVPANVLHVARDELSYSRVVPWNKRTRSHSAY